MTVKTHHRSYIRPAIVHLTALMLIGFTAAVIASQPTPEQRCGYFRDKTIEIKRDYLNGATFEETYIKYPASTADNRMLRDLIVKVYSGETGPLPPEAMGQIFYDVCMVKLMNAR